MIRINLLEEQRASSRGAAVSVPSLPQENLLYYVLQAAMVVVALLVIAGWSWRNNQTISQLNEDIATEEAELRRLKDVLELNKKLEKKRDLLRRKIEVITKLKRGQEVPVRVMDQVSRNLSEYLWLEEVKMKGRKLEMKGSAQNEYAHASFMRNLQNSPYFENVTPKSIKKGRGNLYQWQMEVGFILPEEKAAEQQQQRAAARQ